MAVGRVGQGLNRVGVRGAGSSTVVAGEATAHRRGGAARGARDLEVGMGRRVVGSTLSGVDGDHAGLAEQLDRSLPRDSEGAGLLRDPNKPGAGASAGAG